MTAEHGKVQSFKPFLVFALVATLLLPTLFLAGFYFALYSNSSCQDLEERIYRIEKYQKWSETVLLQLTRAEIVQHSDTINDLSHRIKRDVASVLKEEIKKKRRKRAIIANNGKGQGPFEETKEFKFRSEISSLNERLSRIIDFGGLVAQQENPPGPPGIPGKTGAPGTPGRHGRDGYHGMTGERGPQGIMGPIGNAGLPGKDGLPGSNGIPGLPGYVGQKGQKGASGTSGRNGLNGVTGQMGRTGQTGRPGVRGVKGEPGECSCADSIYAEPYREKRSDKVKPSVTFTMWGSASCPYKSDIIYSGQMSMSKFVRKDGRIVGSNAICIPSVNGMRRSKRSAENSGKNEKRKTIKVSGFKPENMSSAFMVENMTATNLTDEWLSENRTRYSPDYASLSGTRNYVPCATCHGREKVSMVMIPLKNRCPYNWDIEYTGYLMSYHHGSSQSQIVCVNDQALGVSPSSDSKIRAILSEYVRGIAKECQSANCPRWKKELSKCVLCTKSANAPQ